MTRTRRECLKLMGCGAATLTLPNMLLGQTRQKRPNILFMFSDDQRFDTIAAMGNGHIRTPSLDRLVARATAFTHCFIQGSTVGAVCVCSRAMLLTGRSLYRAPQTPRARDATPLWPEVFGDAGYATFITGKWHNGPWSCARSFNQGASIFFGGMNDHTKVPVCDFDPAGKFDKKRTADRFSSELFSDEAVRFLGQYQQPQPFFMYAAYTAPHDPRMAPKPYADMYDPAKIELPGNFLPQHPFDNGEMKVRDEMLAAFPRTPHEIRKHIAAYYAMISHLDAQIGRVLSALQQTGHADDTIVIFAGDNGLALGQHGLMGKQSLYDHSVRVPLLIAGPGIERGLRIDSLVYLSDLFPTTCDLAGLPIPRTVQTQSLAPLLSGKQPRAYESVFAAYRNVQRMVRNDRCKLIRYPYAKRTQLFDMQNDPLEMKDLSTDAAHANVLADMNAQLRKWQQDAGDALDLDNPPPQRAEA